MNGFNEKQHSILEELNKRLSGSPGTFNDRQRQILEELNKRIGKPEITQLSPIEQRVIETQPEYEQKIKELQEWGKQPFKLKHIPRYIGAMFKPITPLPTEPTSEMQQALAEPLIPISKLAKEKPKTIPGKVIKGGLRGIESLTSPHNIALLAATGNIGGTMGQVISATFAVEMGKGSIELGKQINEARKEKDWDRVAELSGELIVSSVFTVGAGKHAIKGKKYQQRKREVVNELKKRTPEQLEKVAIDLNTNIKQGMAKLSEAERFAKLETYAEVTKKHKRIISEAGESVTRKATVADEAIKRGLPVKVEEYQKALKAKKPIAAPEKKIEVKQPSIPKVEKKAVIEPVRPVKEPLETDKVKQSLESRNVKGDKLLDAMDLVEELADKKAEISAEGIVTLYHRTNKANADKINQTGKMIAKEDQLYFGTHPKGQIEGYGDTIVQVRIPIEKLRLEDIFATEAHVTMQSGRPGTIVPVDVVKPKLIETTIKPTIGDIRRKDPEMLRKEDSPLSNYDEISKKEWLGKDTNYYSPEILRKKKFLVYRATPEGNSIQAGDYVTQNKRYAELHIKANLGEEGKITTKEVTLKEIYPADAPNEFWYVPKEKLVTKVELKEGKIVKTPKEKPVKAAPWEMTREEYDTYRAKQIGYTPEFHSENIMFAGEMIFKEKKIRRKKRVEPGVFTHELRHAISAEAKENWNEYRNYDIEWKDAKTGEAILKKEHGFKVISAKTFKQEIKDEMATRIAHGDKKLEKVFPELAEIVNQNIEIFRRDILLKPHREIVQEAIKEGRPVSESVLKDYPDLFPKRKPVEKAKEPQSWIALVNQKGGIKPTKDFDIPLSAKRKTGIAIDDMAKSLQEEGHLIVPRGMNPSDALYQKLVGREKITPTIEKTPKVAEMPREMRMKEQDVVFYEDLKKGDSFKIKGEKYKVIDKGKEKVVIKDGTTHELEPGFSPLNIDKGSFSEPIKIKTEKVEKGKPQISFKPPAELPPGKIKLKPGQKKLERQEGGLFETVRPRSEQRKLELEQLKSEPLPKSEKPSSQALGIVAPEFRGKIKFQKETILEGTDKVLTGDAAIVEQMYQHSAIEVVELKKPSIRKLYRKLKVVTVDMSANVKKELLTKAGDLGKEAVIRKDLVRGASSRGKEIINQAYKDIHDGLSKYEEITLNKIIASRRVIAIKEYRPDVVRTWELSKKQHQKYLDSIPKEIKDKLVPRAEKYFKLMRNQLKELYDEGLIDKELYTNLLSKGDYSKSKFIQYIDPDISYTLGSKKITVTSSGLEKLTTGSKRALDNNSRLLLAEVVARNQQRIFKNRANQALYNLAKNVPENNIVSIFKGKKTPGGYEKIDAMIKGKKVEMLMPSDLAKEWIITDPAIKPGLANFIGWISGNKILKPMATGINPEFALSNFPRDIAHIWLTTGEYSATAPIAGLQMGRDLIRTFPDALKRGKRWKDYLDEGGGMDFLTQQGAVTKNLTGVIGNIQKYLGYVGETSEIWTRLALRERAIRNGKPNYEATHIARNYLDFSQGGSFAKAVDTAVPYLNAGIQGTRGIFRAAAAEPLVFTYKVAQLGALATGLYLANKTQHPDCWEAVSERDKINNFVVTTPWSYRDNSGNKRYIYFRIAKDQGQRLICTLFEATMQKWMGEDIDIDMITQAAQELLPYIPTQNVPPSLDAMLGYYANKDFWRNEDIWRGPKVLPREEYTNYTPQMYIELGKQTGLSPERTKYAIEQYLTYGNIYTSLVGGGLNQILGQLPKMEREKTEEEILTQLPFIRKFSRSTYPYTQRQKKIKEEKIRKSTEDYKNKRELDRLAYQYYKTKSKDDLKKYNVFLSKQPSEKRNYLRRRFRRNKAYYNIPDRRWWINVSFMSPESRATIYFTRWQQSSPEEKEKLEKYMRTLPGIKSKRFHTKLKQLKRRMP